MCLKNLGPARGNSEMIHLRIVDEDDTEYRPITQRRPNSTYSDILVEPFQVTFTLRALLLMGHSRKDLLAILYINEERLRDTWIPLIDDMNGEDVAWSWNNCEECLTIAFPTASIDKKGTAQVTSSQDGKISVIILAGTKMNVICFANTYFNTAITPENRGGPYTQH